MEKNSKEVEPVELIFDFGGKMKRERMSGYDLVDGDKKSSPVKKKSKPTHQHIVKAKGNAPAVAPRPRTKTRNNGQLKVFNDEEASVFPLPSTRFPQNDAAERLKPSALQPMQQSLLNISSRTVQPGKRHTYQMFPRMPLTAHWNSVPGIQNIVSDKENMEPIFNDHDRIEHEDTLGFRQIKYERHHPQPLDGGGHPPHFFHRGSADPFSASPTGYIANPLASSYPVQPSGPYQSNISFGPDGVDEVFSWPY